jgi:hypothetical protein
LDAENQVLRIADVRSGREFELPHEVSLLTAHTTGASVATLSRRVEASL